MAKKCVSVQKCKTCGENAGPSGHLCYPLKKKDATCDWCGSLIVSERHMCADKLSEISYICNTCGRTAVSSEHLCEPKKIK